MAPLPDPSLPVFTLCEIRQVPKVLDAGLLGTSKVCCFAWVRVICEINCLLLIRDDVLKIGKVPGWEMPRFKKYAGQRGTSIVRRV
jgi:hypothetical protein